MGAVSKKWYSIEEIISFKEYGVYINPFMFADFQNRVYFDVLVTDTPEEFEYYYEGMILMKAIIVYCNTFEVRYTPKKYKELIPFIEQLKIKYPIQ
jgi:hypothetical protein